MNEEKTTAGSLALRERQPRVITIAAAQQPEDIKLRVAAYARVSSASEDQLNSFAAQNRYYTTLISGKESWAMVDIYADEGITGTSAEKREDFQRLMADCRRGKIDRILVKSISRFARNTKECLEAIRELKSMGIGVCFEKERIDTSTMSGEMMTAMFAAFAQAESDSISGNMKWSYQRRMQRGEFITCSAPYGYRLHNGDLKVHVEEGEVVYWIYSVYLKGMSMDQIAKMLNQAGVPVADNPQQQEWERSTVAYILKNEKYVGDTLCQKSYTTESLPLVQRKNKGERPQYYIQESHTPIVSRELFDAVQRLRERRSIEKHPERYFAPNPLRQKLVCGKCGAMLKEKGSRGKLYYVCCTHLEDRASCEMLPIATEHIKRAFQSLYYGLKHYGIPILTQMIANLQTIHSCRMLWSMDVISLNKRISDLYSQNQMLATLKQQGLVDPDIFISKTNELTEQLRAAKLEKERLLEAEGDETIAQTQELLDVLEAGPDFLVEFDAELFGELVDKIIVESNERIRFRLKNGLELAETIERTVR